MYDNDGCMYQGYPEEGILDSHTQKAGVQPQEHIGGGSGDAAAHLS